MFDLPELALLLADELTSWRDGQGATTGIGVCECPNRSVLRVEAGSIPELERALNPLPDINAARRTDGVAVWRTGPTVALAISDDLDAKDLAAAVHRSNGAEKLTLTDISHGVVTLELGGAGVRRILSGLVTADLRPRQMPPGHCLRTVLAGHSVFIACLGEDHFDVQIGRSLALSLWHRLEKALRRYG